MTAGADDTGSPDPPGHLQLAEIERFSGERWGTGVAEQYVSDLRASLQRIGEHPGLFRAREGVPPRLLFYPVREHVLVCDMADEILVLAVWHGSLDFPSRLAILEPQFLEEVEILARRLRRH